MPKLLFLVAEDAYFCSHRLGLAKAALAQGFQVAVATRCQHHKETIQQAGITVFPLEHFSRSGLNPWKQLLTLRELLKIYKSYQPDIVHHVAAKPVLLGTLVARWCSIPKIINALGGLGYLFTSSCHSTYSPMGMIKKNILTLIACKLYRWAFSKPNSIVLLQNSDDKEQLMAKGCLDAAKVVIIPGSGIDTQAYPMTEPPVVTPTSPVIISCVSRMLWDKGIGELVAAAGILKQKDLSFKIILYGMPDEENPATIPTKILESWHQQGIIEWRQFCNHVAKAYAESHIATLPSYREGLPKSLLEAASCGRPIVTTNVPGCREIVKQGENGFLVPAKNAKALAEKLEILINNENLRKQMGDRGRQLVEMFFSKEKIYSKLLALYH